jgi:hypothetical protein
MVRGHPAVPRRSSCAAKALTVDLGCTERRWQHRKVHYARRSALGAPGVDIRAEDPTCGVGSQIRFAVTATGVSIEQPRTDRPARTVLVDDGHPTTSEAGR